MPNIAQLKFHFSLQTATSSQESHLALTLKKMPAPDLDQQQQIHNKYVFDLAYIKTYAMIQQTEPVT